MLTFLSFVFPLGNGLIYSIIFWIFLLWIISLFVPVWSAVLIFLFCVCLKILVVTSDDVFTNGCSFKIHGFINDLFYFSTCCLGYSSMNFKAFIFVSVIVDCSCYYQLFNYCFVFELIFYRCVKIHLLFL